MFPDIDNVLRKRYLAGIVIRAIALGFVVLAAIPFARFIVDGFIIAPILTPNRLGTRYVQSLNDIIAARFPEIMRFLLPGLLLMALHGRLSRWLVPLPKPRCPECGYWIKRGGRPQCSECGAALPKALVERGGDDAPDA